MHRDKSAKMAIWQKIAILALLFLCIDFKFSFGKMTFGWVLWKSYYTLLLKKCLRPCPGLSIYLSERMNWIISSFPRWISKIPFGFNTWDHFGSLGCRIRECSFFYGSILFLLTLYVCIISHFFIEETLQSSFLYDRKQHIRCKLHDFLPFLCMFCTKQFILQKSFHVEGQQN